MIIAPDTLDFVQKIVLDNELLDGVAPDGIKSENIALNDLTNRVWLIFSTEEDGEVGVIGIDALNNSTIAIHPYLLPKDRKKGLGKQMMKEFFEYYLENSPETIVKINCKIAKCFPETYHFAKSMGFVDEGMDRLSFLKRGSLWDQYCLGITRQEIEGKYHVVHNRSAS